MHITLFWTGGNISCGGGWGLLRIGRAATDGTGITIVDSRVPEDVQPLLLLGLLRQDSHHPADVQACLGGTIQYWIGDAAQSRYRASQSAESCEALATSPPPSNMPILLVGRAATTPLA